MNKARISLLSIILASLLSGCMGQQVKEPSIGSVHDLPLKTWLKANPLPYPRSDTLTGYRPLINTAIYRECVLADYLGLPKKEVCSPKRSR